MFLAPLQMKYFFMKKFIPFLAFAFVAFTTQPDTEGLVNALKAGNAAQVANYFDTYIDLTLPSKEEIKNIGKNQAAITLQSFFTEGNIKGFDLSSQREAGATMYITGKLQGSKPYNITILLKNKDGKHSITSIRIN